MACSRLADQTPAIAFHENRSLVMNSNSRAVAVAALLLATSAWGSLFLVGKPVLSHVDPLWFTLIRYTLATAALAPLVLWRGDAPLSKLRAHAPRLALSGFVGYGVFGVMVLTGLAHSVPSHGAVIMATMPITTQLVRWALDGIKPTRAALIGTALALAGVIIVSGVLFNDAGSGRSTAAGDLTAFIGTLGWIAYTRSSARLPSLNVLEYTALTAVASWPLLLLAALVGAAVHVARVPSAEDLAVSWQALLYIAAVPSVMAILAYNFGVKALGVVTGTAFLNFVPVSALLMCVALGAPPSAHELLGVALVVSALLVHTGAQKRLASRQQALVHCVREIAPPVRASAGPI
jgi:drug/metabolite transporter (DMT)-like permease